MIVPAKASSQRRFFFLISERGESGAKKDWRTPPARSHTARGAATSRAKGRHYRECGIYEKRVLQVVICTPFYATSRPQCGKNGIDCCARVFVTVGRRK